MIIYKVREKPVTLAVLDALRKRMAFTPEQEAYRRHQQRGYGGESGIDVSIHQLKGSGVVLNDLLLTIDGTTCQIDVLILTARKVFLLEVKNYEGEYYYSEDQRLFLMSGKEILNPLHRLERTTVLFRQFLHQQNRALEVESRVVFVNPKFSLFQAPRESSFVLPSQVHTLLQRIQYASRENTEHLLPLAECLVNRHRADNPYLTLPEYSFERLQKGIFCERCGCAEITLTGHSYSCPSCQHRDKFLPLLALLVDEFRLLFPHLKLTTALIFEWCGGRISKKRITRFLKAHYTQIGTTRGVYYV